MSSGQHLHSATTSSSLPAGYPIPSATVHHTTATASTTVAGRRTSKKHNCGEHITFEDGVAIDATLHEIPQKPYSEGIGAERDAAMRIDYRPRGFTVGRVLSGDVREISNPNEVVVRLGGTCWQEKASFHLEFCDPAFGRPFREQQRVKKGPARHATRATFALFVAEGMQKTLERHDFARFPYAFNEIRVVSIDVGSRGTLQPRIFVDDFAIAVEQTNVSLGERLQELQELHGLVWPG